MRVSRGSADPGVRVLSKPNNFVVVSYFNYCLSISHHRLNGLIVGNWTGLMKRHLDLLINMTGTNSGECFNHLPFLKLYNDRFCVRLIPWMSIHLSSC